jgi:hypothetical protein
MFNSLTDLSSKLSATARELERQQSREFRIGRNDTSSDAVGSPLPEPWTAKSLAASQLNPREDFSAFA